MSQSSIEPSQSKALLEVSQSKELLDAMPKMCRIIASSEKLLNEALESEKLIGVLNEISTLLAFNLVDMVNIAIDEGTFYRSKEWLQINGRKYPVAGNIEKWKRHLLVALDKLSDFEYMKTTQSVRKWDKFMSTVEFFRNLKTHENYTK